MCCVKGSLLPHSCLQCSLVSFVTLNLIVYTWLPLPTQGVLFYGVLSSDLRGMHDPIRARLVTEPVDKLNWWHTPPMHSTITYANTTYMQCETKRDCWSERDYDVVWDSVTKGAACPAAPRHPVPLWTGPGARCQTFLQNKVNVKVTLHRQQPGTVAQVQEFSDWNENIFCCYKFSNFLWLVTSAVNRACIFLEQWTLVSEYYRDWGLVFPGQPVIFFIIMYKGRVESSMWTLCANVLDNTC